MSKTNYAYLSLVIKGLFMRVI